MRRLTAEQIEELRLELHEVESDLESELDEMASDLGETKVALRKAWRERDAALAQAKVEVYALAAGSATERAKIVAWLRDLSFARQHDETYGPLADRIESGEHEKDGKPQGDH